MSVNIEKYLHNIHTPNGRIYPHLDCWGLVCYVYQNELNIQLDLCTDCKTYTIFIPRTAEFTLIWIVGVWFAMFTKAN